MIQIEVQAARLDADAPASQRSATVVLRDLGALAVQVFFHGLPMDALQIEFFKATPEGEAGEAIGQAVTTDAQGIAAIGHAVHAGTYVCRIEHQPDAIVATVEDPARPFPIVLPIGRPYLDIDGDAEFAVSDSTSAPAS
jgi:hypothetical protein